MVVYEWEMIDRFLENSVFLDIPLKFLLLARCQCLAMFALKVILKNVQKLNISSQYVTEVILNKKGKRAMLLAVQVAVEFYEGKDISYLEKDVNLGIDTDILFKDKGEVSTSKTFFSNHLHTYILDKKHLFSDIEKPQERNTRAPTFSISSAKRAAEAYIDALWSCIEKRVQFTDLSNSPCAFSEAPAETVFSIYSRVTQGREALSICNAVALTRVALHGPPVATPSSKAFTKSAMDRFESKYGPRFCTKMWFKGATSTLKKIQSKEKDF